MVGIEVLEMVTMNCYILEREIFGGDGLHQFIQDHQDRITELEDQLGNIITMASCTCCDLQITNQVLWS